MHETGRRTWGHSMIVDPWGDVLDVLPEGEGVVMAEMDRARIDSVRMQLPALTHRRCPIVLPVLRGPLGAVASGSS